MRYILMMDTLSGKSRVQFLTGSAHRHLATALAICDEGYTEPEQNPYLVSTDQRLDNGVRHFPAHESELPLYGLEAPTGINRRVIERNSNVYP